jgi:FlaA1/EpsC-like NDP-sugar epimerase
MIYQYIYDYANRNSELCGPVWKLVEVFSGLKLTGEKLVTSPVPTNTKIRIAIVGAGHVGASLAEELVRNQLLPYTPVCFIDNDCAKVGRDVVGIPVLSDAEATAETLTEYQVQEIVFALPQMMPEQKKDLYEQYKKTGCKLKVYDYPMMQTAGNGFPILVKKELSSGNVPLSDTTANAFICRLL